MNATSRAGASIWRAGAPGKRGGDRLDLLVLDCPFASRQQLAWFGGRGPSEELREAGMRIMVVCPGFVKTEFHPIQAMDMSSLPFAATPDVIVQATMAGLAAGELFCLPTMDDTIALKHLKAAEREWLGGGRSGTLAARHSSE